MTLKEGFEVHGDRVAFDGQNGLWTVTSATVCAAPRAQAESFVHVVCADKRFCPADMCGILC